MPGAVPTSHRVNELDPQTISVVIEMVRLIPMIHFQALFQHHQLATISFAFNRLNFAAFFCFVSLKSRFLDFIQRIIIVKIDTKLSIEF